MATLTRQQMISTWQGLQGMLRGLPSGDVPTTQIEGLSDSALLSRIRLQQTSIDNNAAIRGRSPAFDPNGRVPTLGSGPQETAGARAAAITTLKRGIENPSQVDSGQFHAIIAAYSDGQKFTIPDLSFDRSISDAEKKAASEIARRLEAGENAPAIRQAFGAQANVIQQQQRTAAEAAAREAAEAQTRARAQQNLHTAVDSHFAAMGMIKPEAIGSLSGVQRANYLTQFMRDNAIALQRQGSASSAFGNLTRQQAAAIDMTGTQGVTANALVILQSGRQGTHMAEEVRNWLESGNREQIMMAQSTIGATVTGEIDVDTHRAGLQYVTAPYATKLEDLSFVRNPTGTINPSLLWEAANKGTLYIPTDAELRAAGVTDDQIATLQGTRPANELVAARAALRDKPRDQFTAEDRAVWVADTREELVANMYLENPALYTKVIEARNAVAATSTLNVTAPVAAVQQQQFLQNFDSIPQTRVGEGGALTTATGQALPENLPAGVREMIDAKRLVESAEENLRRVTIQPGGTRIDPATGRELMIDAAQERLKATRAVDQAYAGYDTTEQSLRTNGTFDQVMSYIDQMNKGITPTIRIEPRGAQPPASAPATPDSAPPSSGEPARISMLGNDGRPREVAMFTSPAVRGQEGIDSLRRPFGSAVTPEDGMASSPQLATQQPRLGSPGLSPG